MEIKHAVNGGLAEVDDETGKLMIASGGWVASAPAPAAKKAAPAKPEPAK